MAYRLISPSVSSEMLTGLIESGVYVVVVHERELIGGEMVTRIISARKATKYEQITYYEQVAH